MKVIIKNLLYFTLFFMLSSFDFEKFNIDKLEKESILYNSSILAKSYSGNKSQWRNSYGKPQAKKICEKSSVWLDFYPRSIITDDNKSVLQTLANNELWDFLKELGIEGIHTNPMKLSGGFIAGHQTPSVDGNYDRISLKIDPLFGTDSDYIKMTKTVHDHQAIVIGDLIPGHTGQGPDFILACLNYKDYPGIYTIVEIDEKDWNVLPQVKDEEFSKNLNFQQVATLKEKGYIVGRLQRVIFAEEGIKQTNWDATKVIKGIDGKNRRWVFLHVFKAGQPSLNWLDPTFAANRLIAGDIMQSLGVLNIDGLRLDANGFLGLEKTKDKAWSEGHPLSEVATNLIAMLVRKVGHLSRKLGGFTFQELNLTMSDLKQMLRLGADFAYDFITRTAYWHAIINEDADFLRLNLNLMKDAKISPVRFIHALQNHDELTYELVDFSENAKKTFEYKDQQLTGKQLKTLIRDQDFLKILTNKTPYILPSGNGPCTTLVGLCAAALGIKDIFSMTMQEKEKVKKAHVLLTVFNAMQPGIFMVSGWDLVGAYPLKKEQIKDLIKDGDNRWANRGAYDLLGNNPNKTSSFSGIPKAQTLYGSLKDQLKDPLSYANHLKKLLKIRKTLNLNLASVVDIIKVKNPALYLALYKVNKKDLVLIALNFSKKELVEDFRITEIKNKNAIDLFSDLKENKNFFSNKYRVKLKPLEAKVILFQ